MGERLVVYDAVGHGKLVAEILLADGQQIAGFLDDNPTLARSAVLDVPIFPAAEGLEKNAGEKVALAIGNNCAT